MEIYIELLRPVNPTGRSFITNVYGAIAAKDRELTEKYKKEITKLMVKWQITNINTVVYFNVPIKLGPLADKICKDYVISYHPEDFPGLVIYLKFYKCYNL